MIRSCQGTAEDKEKHCRYFKLRGIYQVSCKIIKRTEEQTLESASQNITVAPAIQTFATAATDRKLRHEKVTSATVNYKNILF